jgi:hypothetical protein
MVQARVAVADASEAHPLRASAPAIVPSGDSVCLVGATGRCECGGVRYSVTAELRDVYDCHCGRCRRITGHYLAATAAPRDCLTLLTERTLTWYSPDPTVEYGFCSRCGSTLFWRAQSEPGSVSIAAGTLDPPTGLRTTAAWWVAEASDYHERPQNLVEHAYDG